MGVANLFPFRCHECAIKFYAFLEEETFAGHLPEQIALSAQGFAEPPHHRQPSGPSARTRPHHPAESARRGGAFMSRRRQAAKAWMTRCSICWEPPAEGES